MLDSGPITLGVLSSLTGVGSVLGALVIATLPERNRGKLLLASGILLGLAVIGFAVSRSVWVTGVIVILIGIGHAGRMALGAVLLQTYADEEYRGRVMALYMMQFSIVSFGVFGLVMATSACPYMDFLKPMARFHLPFSTAEETIVRSVSMYLLHQYFVAKRGGSPDLGLELLETHYEDIQKVNDGILERIKGVVQNDADLNALIILQGFADLLTMAISKDLSKIEPLFFRKP